MLRIAVQNPVFLFYDQNRNYNGYNYSFFQKYVSAIYLCTLPIDSREKRTLLDKKNILFNIDDLNREADVLICFNGEPYLFGNEPEKDFHGIKIYHAMDFVYRASFSNQLFVNSGVDYLMGYCKHDQYSPFFRKYYNDYIEKVISVPFGYGQRFNEKVPFEKRKNMAIALGSVNPVDDPLCPKGILDEYIEFYSNEKFTHRLRREIVMHRDEWKDAISSELLPDYPNTKNMSYDPVVEMQKYTMFINDAGIMNFPPARTFEGIAAGCVMVAEDSPVYSELGFIDGYNAILFGKGNYAEMIYKIRYYINNRNLLKVIHDNSIGLAKHYSHDLIADNLYFTIKNVVGGM